MYVVIMAGGGGTRLWPLSTPERPKPFLPLLGAESLLQRTVERLAGPELSVRPSHMAVVTDRRYASLVRSQLPDVTLLEEPVGRNTAPAVALAAFGLDRPPDEVMAVLPADHLIRDEAEFRAVLSAATEAADSEPQSLVTLGIEPTGPQSGYGYIVPGAPLGGAAGRVVHAVERFVEKPAMDVAEALLAGPNRAAWNAGIFVGRRSAIAAAFGRFAPDIADEIHAGVRLGRLDTAYERIRATSIDYAVVEPAAAAGLVRVLRLDVGWSDLGSWTALLEALGGEGSGQVAKDGQRVDVDAGDLIVQRFDHRLAVTRVSGPSSMAAYEPIAVLRGARASQGLVEALVSRCSDPEGLT